MRTRNCLPFTNPNCLSHNGKRFRLIWRGLTELDPGEVPPPSQVAHVKENLDFTIHKNVHGFGHVFLLATEVNSYFRDRVAIHGSILRSIFDQCKPYEFILTKPTFGSDIYFLSICLLNTL